MPRLRAQRRRRPRSPRGAPVRPRWIALALCAASCGGAGPRPPNALLVTLDTTRADALGTYGAPAGTTPHLDALAAEGITFTAARTVAPLTLPAHASIMTGLYPPRHGLRDNELWALPAEAHTLAEAAAEAGFETAGFAAAAVLDRAFGLAQGFEVWGQPERARAVGEHGAELPAELVAERALAWLAARDRRRPFLCWLHFYDAHLPLSAPEHFVRQARGNPYLAEVARADQALGRVLEALTRSGELERTVIAVVGDHGEANGEHGEGTHGNFVYDPTLRVPLIVRLPGAARAGTADGGVVSVVDLHATLAALLGLEIAPGLDGLDLFAARPADRGVYFESYHGYLHSGWSPLAGWVEAQAKYVHSSSPQLFEPHLDPGESVDRIAAAPAADLARWRARIAEVAARPALSVEQAGAERELAESIRALGYAEATATSALPGPLEETDLPSPHARAGELERVARASDLARAGERARAAALFREVLAANPANGTARGGLAYALMEAGELEQAAAEFEILLATSPRSAANHAALGACLEGSGREEEALEHYRVAAEIDGGDVDNLRRLAALLGRTGRSEEAEVWRARIRELAAGEQE